MGQWEVSAGAHLFFGVRDTEGLQRLWETQLKFVFEKQFKYEPDVVEEIRGKFVEITGVDLQPRHEVAPPAS